MTSSRRVRVAPLGRLDVRAIRQYTLDTWGEEQGDAYLASPNEVLRRVGEFPSLRRPRDDVRPVLRAFTFGQHVILYRVEDDEVIVLRVVHARQDISRLYIP